MRRHATDTLSLITGLFFATFAIVWLVDDVWPMPPQLIGLVFAWVFLLAGLVGLIRAIRRPRSTENEDS